MQLANLLRETLDVEEQDVWENERTPTPVRRFGVRLHSMGLSVRETEAVLGWLGVDRSHGAVWQWTHRLADSGTDPLTAQSSRVAVDETAVQIGEEWCWLYAAIDLESLLLLDVELFSRHQNAAFWLANESSVLVNAAGLTPQRRSFIISPRTTMSPRRNFSSMASAIRLPSPDPD